MKKIIKSIFAFFNIAVRSKSKLDKKLSNSISLEKWKHDIKFTLQIGSHLGPDFLKHNSFYIFQIRQKLI